jgi:beta-lactamase class A
LVAWVAGGVAVVALVLSLVTIGATIRYELTRGGASPPAAAPSPTPSASTSPTPPASPSPTATVSLPPRSFTALSASLTTIERAAGARISVSLIELGGSQREAWSLGGDVKWTAASTYKLPLLMDEARGIADGRLHGSDVLCYGASDWETGYFTDYDPGECFTRDVLAERVGRWSDNTAAHILVRYLGGGDALNAFAKSMGATESEFYDDNFTTSSDLARLWNSEARGDAGGAAAQRWLYPLLTNTADEAGIPAGTPSAPVIHKFGAIGTNLHDAALVAKGPHGPYVLVICSDAGAAGGWPLLARIAKQVWQFEFARTST